MESLIFWYTGATVWLIIAGVVAALTILAAILTIAKTSMTLRQFWFIKKFCTAVTEGDIDRMRRAYSQACLKYGTPFKEDAGDKSQKWLTHLAKFYMYIGDQYTESGDKLPMPEGGDSLGLPLKEYAPTGNGSSMQAEMGGGWMDANEVRRYIKTLEKKP